MRPGRPSRDARRIGRGAGRRGSDNCNAARSRAGAGGGGAGGADGGGLGAPRAEGAVYGALARLPEIDHAFELSEQAEKSGEDQRAQRRHHPGPGGRYLVCGLCAQIGGDAGDQVGQGVGGIF